MPFVPVLMPQLGESIAEATILRIDIQIGSTVSVDQELIEVETNKAVMSVTTLCGGIVSEIFCEEGVSYAVGSTLAMLEVTEEELTKTGVSSLDHAPQAPNSHSEKSEEENLHFSLGDETYQEKITQPTVIPSIKGLPVPTGQMSAHYVSPRMRARMNEMGLREADMSAVAGTGAGGRVTVEDLEKFLDDVQSWPSSKASPMRLAVADAMRRSWTRPLATVALPTRLDATLQHRRTQQPKPGLTLYLLRAFALALRENPETAGFLIGQNIVHPRSFDIGFAVQVEDGVVVPVIRKADEKSLAELTQEYDDLVTRARMRRLPEVDLKGGIATVTNFGTFGLTYGTPIPLPNETLILGIGAGVKKPIWNDEQQQFLPATEADLALTFDHRVVDGGGAGILLQNISRFLQNPEQL